MFTVAVENYRFIYSIIDGPKERNVLVYFEVTDGYSFCGNLTVLKVIEGGVDVWHELKADPVLRERVWSACAMFCEEKKSRSEGRGNRSFAVVGHVVRK